VDASLGTVTTAPPAAGEKATASDSHHATVLTTKSGKTTLRATAGGKTYDVPLTITQYTRGRRELGNDLYQLNRSARARQPWHEALGCIGCHGNQGTARHSPSEVGGFATPRPQGDRTAVKPDGSLANKGAHKFVLDDTEKPAILARRPIARAPRLRQVVLSSREPGHSGRGRPESPGPAHLLRAGKQSRRRRNKACLPNLAESLRFRGSEPRGMVI